MNKLRTLYAFIAAALAAVALGACSDREEPAVPGGEAGSEVFMETRLTITIPSISDDELLSRAPGHGDDRYDTGSGYENYIDLERGDFAFYFFDSDNNYITDLQVTSLLPVGSDARSKTFTLLGRVQGSLMTSPVKVVALANWGGDYPEQPADIDELTARTFDFSAGRMHLSADNTIPLYGVTNLMTLSTNSLDMADLGTIHLLRAFAKVQVKVSMNSADDIESVTLTRHNTSGFCAPAGIYSQDAYVHGGNYDEDYVNTPHIPTGAETSEPLEFMAASDGSFVAYIPEYRNIGRNTSEQAQMRVKFKNSADPGILEFKFYNSPSEPSFDVLRNYWYVFGVERDHYDMDLRVTVQVVPYGTVDLTPDFGLVIEKGFVPIYNDLGVIIYYYSSDTGLYYLDPFGNYPAPAPDPGFQRDPIRGWMIIRDQSGKFLYYFDEENNKWYNDKFQEIPNPALSGAATTDPATGWKVMTEGSVTYYYDEVNNRYYTIDRQLLYRHPDGHLCWQSGSQWKKLDGSSSTTPLPANDAKNDVKNPTWLIVRDADKVPIYYYDNTVTKWYDMVNRTEIPSPLFTDARIVVSPVDGLMLVRDGNGRFIYFYDKAKDIWYDTNRKKINNPTANDPRIHIDPQKGWQVIRNQQGRFICYFTSTWDSSQNKWIDHYYDINRKEIAKPDLT